MTDTVTMLAPDHGFLAILYSVNLGQDNSGGGTSPHRYQMAPMIDGTDLDGHALVLEVDFGANANDTTEPLQRVINVAPGTYQVGVRLVKSDTISRVDLRRRPVTHRPLHPIWWGRGTGDPAHSDR